MFAVHSISGDKVVVDCFKTLDECYAFIDITEAVCFSIKSLDKYDVKIDTDDGIVTYRNVNADWLNSMMERFPHWEVLSVMPEQCPSRVVMEELENFRDSVTNG